MNHNDAALVARVLGGEKAAFGFLVDRHRPAAARLARRLCGAAAEVDDIVQEALLQAFLNLEALQTADNFGAWLLGIVANLCKTRLRTRHARLSVEDWDGGRVPPDFTWMDMAPSPEAVYEIRELHRMVLAAIATLPAAQQQAVRLHYLEGLTLWEIGQLAGVPVGAVKARLHRARARLRTELTREFAEARESITPTDEEAVMIEVTVYDVIVRMPKGEEVKWLGEEKEDVHKFVAGGMWIILLKEQIGDRILPIWVGIAEGNWIAMQLAEVSMPRPMTFDLMARLLEVTGNKVEKVAVTRLHENTYYATLWLNVDGRVHEVDVRPSDALNLALRMKAPIFVTPEVLEQVGPFLLTTGEVATGLEALHRKATEEKRMPPEEVELEYRSFRSLPRGDLGGRLKPAEK